MKILTILRQKLNIARRRLFDRIHSILEIPYTRMLKRLAWLMVIFFISGTVITMWAQSDIEENYDIKTGIAEYVFRAVLSSLDMFILDMDSNMLDRLDKSPQIKNAIAIQSMASFACTVALIATLVLARLRAYLRLRHISRRLNKKHIYLFFGVNPQSVLLAKSIDKHDPDDSIIVFVESANIDEDKTDGVASLIGLFTHRRRSFALAEKHRAYVAVSSHRLHEVELSDNFEDVFDRLDIRNIATLLERFTGMTVPGRELHMFLLSDNEDNNMAATLVLTHDSTVSRITATNEKYDETPELKIKMRIYL